MTYQVMAIHVLLRCTMWQLFLMLYLVFANNELKERSIPCKAWQA